MTARIILAVAGIAALSSSPVLAQVNSGMYGTSSTLGYMTGQSTPEQIYRIPAPSQTGNWRQYMPQNQTPPPRIQRCQLTPAGNGSYIERCY